MKLAGVIASTILLPTEPHKAQVEISPEACGPATGVTSWACLMAGNFAELHALVLTSETDHLQDGHGMLSDLQSQAPV